MSGVAVGLEILQIAEQLAASYAKMRALAAQQGVTDDQLAEADARFQRRVSPAEPYVDPLPPPPPPPVDPTTQQYPTLDGATAAWHSQTGADGSNAYVVITVTGDKIAGPFALHNKFYADASFVVYP